MRKLCFGSLLLLFSVVLVGLPALALPNNPHVIPETNFPDGFGQRGGTYQFAEASGDPTFLNPFLATGDSQSRNVTDLAGITFFPVPLDGFSGDPIELTNGMVEMFEVDDFENPTTVTMKLRAGLQWSDGEVLDADDAEFTFLANIDERFVEVARSDGLLVDDQFPGFEKIDNLTFRYTIPGPVGIGAYLLQLNLILLPQHAHQAAFDNGDLASEAYWSPQFATENPSAIIGAGPFRLVSGVIGQEWTFERNEFYWKVDGNGTQLPYFDNVRLLVVENRDVELLKFLNGESHTLTPRPSDLPVIQQRADELGIVVSIRAPASNGTANFISYNQDIGLIVEDGQAVSEGDAFKDSLRQLFREKDFRKAISKGTDRQSVADNIFLGLSAPIFQMSGLGRFDISGRPASGGTLDPAYPTENFEFDVDAANALLDGLDLPIGSDGLRVFGDSYPAAGQKVSVALRTNVENSNRVDTITLLANDYTELLHVEHVTDPVPFGAAVGDLLVFPSTDGESFPQFEAFHIGIGGGSTDPTGAFVQATSGGFLHLYRNSDSLTDNPPGTQAQMDELWSIQAAFPSVTNEGDVGGIPGLLFGSSQERFDVVREMQLLLAEDQNVIYIGSGQRLSAFYGNIVGNSITAVYDDTNPNGSLLVFCERGFRVDL